jgi:hypothetical protein
VSAEFCRLGYPVEATGGAHWQVLRPFVPPTWLRS